MDENLSTTFHPEVSSPPPSAGAKRPGKLRETTFRSACAISTNKPLPEGVLAIPTTGALMALPAWEPYDTAPPKG